MSILNTCRRIKIILLVEIVFSIMNIKIKQLFILLLIVFSHNSFSEADVIISNQILYENEYFSVQMSEQAKSTKKSIAEEDLDMTILAGGFCEDVNVVLIHLLFNAMEEHFTLDDVKGMGMEQEFNNEKTFISETKKEKVNNINSVKYTIEYKENTDFLTYLYVWPNKNQVFQLVVSGTRKMHAVAFEKEGNSITYLDKCPDYYNYTNTLKLK